MAMRRRINLNYNPGGMRKYGLFTGSGCQSSAETGELRSTGQPGGCSHMSYL